MEINIKELTEEIFQGIPLSAESERAKNDVKRALSREYSRQLSLNQTPLQAAGFLMNVFGTLPMAAGLAGYTDEDVKRWKSEENVMGRWRFHRLDRKMAFCTCMIAIFFSSFLMQTVQCLVLANPYYLLSAGLSLGVALLFFRSWYRVLQKTTFGRCRMDAGATRLLWEKDDRFRKRFMNSLFIGLLLFCAFGIYAIIASRRSDVNKTEFISSVFPYITVVEIGIFLGIKNGLRVYWLDACLPRGRSLYRLYTLVLGGALGIYCLAVLVALVIFRRETMLFYVIVFVSGCLYLTFVLLSNFSIRSRFVRNNLVFNKQRVLAFGMAGVVLLFAGILRMDTWIVQPYISTVSTIPHTEDSIAYNEENGVFTITTEKEDFRILQLSDIHLGGSIFSSAQDLKALRACYALIADTRPDLVIVTGDLVFPMGIMSFSFNNSTPIMQFASFMRNVGIPWAFLYGNHDTEAIATSSEEDVKELFRSLSYRTSGSLLYPYVQPQITGRNNQLIELRNADGSLRQALFLLDSNSYTGEGLNAYDYIHDDEVEWYEGEVRRLSEEEGKTISSMVFFHMPLQEYRTAYELYTAGSDEVTYFFGENAEKMIDKICCSEYPSRLFDAAVALGSTKAMFCGHDHYNNLSVEYRGIRLTYGMSIDYLAMPGIEFENAQRGGTLITLKPDSGYTIEQCPLSKVTAGA